MPINPYNVELFDARRGDSYLEPEGQMNAKILLELPGVEAGDTECDPCCEYLTCYCNEDGESAECKLFRGRNLHLKADDCSPLRCPACLRAEVKVPENPTEEDLFWLGLKVAAGYDGLYNTKKGCSCFGGFPPPSMFDGPCYCKDCNPGYDQNGSIGPKKEKS
jgi:hypothetical protein